MHIDVGVLSTLGISEWSKLSASPSCFAGLFAQPRLWAVTSIQLERVLVVELERGVLLVLLEEAVADHEVFDFGSHEAAKRIICGANDRLATDVEAGIDHHRAAGERLKTAEQRMIARVGLLMHRLHARRVVHVGYCRNIRTRHVELVDPEQRLLFVGHGASAFLGDTSDEQHVGDSPSSSKQSATSSRKTEGANGRKLSRYLTLRFSIFCMVGERGSPRIERFPSARGRNSMRPCIQPTAFPALNDFAVRSITSWSEKVVNLAPAAASSLSTCCWS